MTNLLIIKNQYYMNNLIVFGDLQRYKVDTLLTGN